MDRVKHVTLLPDYCAQCSLIPRPSLPPLVFHCTETTLVWSLPLNMAQSLHSAAQRLEKVPVNM